MNIMAYGSELRYMKGLSWRGRLAYALLGELSVGHRLRFLINRHTVCLENSDHRILQILEMGSSKGQFCFWLSRFPCYTVIGLECNEALVRECEQIRTRLGRTNLRFIYADAALPYPLAEQFDLIFSVHVLEHIRDDGVALKNAYNQLKPEGRLIVHVPYGDPEKPPSPDMVCNGHMREGYTPDDIRQKVENAGFQVETLEGSVGSLGGLVWQLGQVKKPWNIFLFPIGLILLSLEQVTYRFRKKTPPFSSGILLIARKE